MKPLVFVISGKSPITMPGGLGAYAYNTAKILSQMGYDIHIIGFSSTNETLQIEKNIKLHHVTTPYKKLAGVGAFLIISELEKRMLEIFRQSPSDRIIIYSAGIWGAAGVKLKRRLKRENVPVQTMVAYFTTYQHEYDGHLKGTPIKDYGFFSYLMIKALNILARLYFRPREHDMLKSSDAVVVHYNSTRDILLNEIKDLSSNKIHKIPYYTDLYERESEYKYQQKSGETSIPTVSVICRQDPRKGINTFIKAVRILLDRGVKFNCNIAGSGIFLKQHKALAKKLNLERAINFLGFVNVVEDVLNDTDIYVLPSVEEGSGAISLLEAMKKGVAIVTTRCDGIPEDFVDHQTGLLVDPGNETQMADALQELIEDPELRTKLSSNVSEDYHRRFTFDKMKHGLEHLISNLSH